MDYEIKIAKYGFICPACGSRVRYGENYVEQDEIRTCLCAMPGRKLIPVGNGNPLVRQLADTPPDAFAKASAPKGRGRKSVHTNNCEL